MKMKVVETMKGKLVIPFVYGDFRAGDSIELTKEQAESPDVQNLLVAGLLLTDEPLAKTSEVIVEYKNQTPQILMFSWGLSVRPMQRFFLPQKNLILQEVKHLVKESKIISIKDLNNKDKKSKKVEKVVEQENKKSKKIKRISEEETNENGVYVVNPNKEEQKPLPKGVYIHQPSKDKSAKLIDDQIQDIDQRLSEGMEFVDLKQSKEKLLKTQKTIQSRKGE